MSSMLPFNLGGYMTTHTQLMEALNNIYTDLEMLRDGSWDGDPEGAADSQAMLDTVANILISLNVLPSDYSPTDIREETNAYLP